MVEKMNKASPLPSIDHADARIAGTQAEKILNYAVRLFILLTRAVLRNHFMEQLSWATVNHCDVNSCLHSI